MFRRHFCSGFVFDSVTLYSLLGIFNDSSETIRIKGMKDQLCAISPASVVAFRVACVAAETKPLHSPSANQRPKACSALRMLPGFSTIGSNWLLHMAGRSCTVIGLVDLVEPWLRFR